MLNLNVNRRNDIDFNVSLFKKRGSRINPSHYFVIELEDRFLRFPVFRRKFNKIEFRIPRLRNNIKLNKEYRFFIETIDENSKYYSIDYENTLKALGGNIQEVYFDV